MWILLLMLAALSCKNETKTQEVKADLPQEASPPGATTESTEAPGENISETAKTFIDEKEDKPLILKMPNDPNHLSAEEKRLMAILGFPVPDNPTEEQIKTYREILK